jgi:hypothetical protein
LGDKPGKNDFIKKFIGIPGETIYALAVIGADLRFDQGCQIFLGPNIPNW